MTGVAAYIIAARRTALGRIGGLHRSRRIEALTAPVITAALADCGLSPERVEEVVIGNATAGGNPTRAIALAAGLPETAPAATIDRQCGSGLDAILAAIRSIGAGEADVVVAGGADSVSTAPWRIAKPKSLYQTPHFIGVEPAAAEARDEPAAFEAAEDLARRMKFSRARQDAWAAQTHLKAESAREARSFVGEIVPLRAEPHEARDESAIGADPHMLERLSPFQASGGTLTPGNTAQLHDGAAIVVVVSERVWQELGKPKALRLVAATAQGVAPDAEATAPVEAMKRLYGRIGGINTKDIGVVEMGETSAAQALALIGMLGFDDAIVNPSGGAIARGHPFGAAGAVLVVRLFTDMVRTPLASKPRYGAVTQGTLGGMGLAALFEAV